MSLSACFTHGLLDDPFEVIFFSFRIGQWTPLTFATHIVQSIKGSLLSRTVLPIRFLSFATPSLDALARKVSLSPVNQPISTTPDENDHPSIMVLSRHSTMSHMDIDESEGSFSTALATVTDNVEHMDAYSMMQLQAKLPPELWMSILDMLGSEKDMDLQTMKACSLTCKAWAQYTERYIHRYVDMSLSKESRMRYYDPRLASHVREIYFEDFSFSHYPDPKEADLSEESQDSLLSWSILSLFPNLEKVTLFNCTFIHLKKDAITTLTNAFARVREVVVQHIELYTFNVDFPPFVSLFPSAQCFSFEDVRCEDWSIDTGWDEVVPVLSRFFLQVPKLRFEGRGEAHMGLLFMAIGQYIPRIPKFHPEFKLKLHQLRPYEVETLPFLLKPLAPHVAHLTMWDFPIANVDLEENHISELTKLTTLSLSNTYIDGPEWLDDFLGLLPTSAPLKTLKIKCYTHLPGDSVPIVSSPLAYLDGQLNFDHLDEILTKRAPFLGLQKVSIQYDLDWVSEETEGVIAEHIVRRLPRLASKNILFVKNIYGQSRDD
ncbi:hypothetical protein K474DRAFT_670980 [Panus rudis PR-1116 ss-1]|nr:hypothetical protein K474DRAFT_670980 [Panus rudis PR-1116 ss-1]